MVLALDAWAAPIKASTQKATGGEDEGTAAAGSTGTLEGTGSEGAGDGPSTSGSGYGGASEAERFGAVKRDKDALSRAIAVFNAGSPLKAIRLLVASGAGGRLGRRFVLLRLAALGWLMQCNQPRSSALTRTATSRPVVDRPFHHRLPARH